MFYNTYHITNAKKFKSFMKLLQKCLESVGSFLCILLQNKSLTSNNGLQ
jgi:hypothetical protein